MAYLNARERGLHIAVFSTLVNIERLLESKQINDDIKRNLKTAVDNLYEFNNKMFAEFGDKYKQTLYNQVNGYEICLMPRVSKKVDEAKKRVEQGTAMREVLDEVGVNCFGCEKKTFRNCKYFKFFDYFEKQGESDNKECPFKEG